MVDRPNIRRIKAWNIRLGQFGACVFVSVIAHYVAVFAGFLAILFILGKSFNPAILLFGMFYIPFFVSGALIACIEGMTNKKLISILGAILAVILLLQSVESFIVFKSDKTTPRNIKQRILDPDFLKLWYSVPCSLIGCVACEFCVPKLNDRNKVTSEPPSES